MTSDSTITASYIKQLQSILAWLLPITVLVATLLSIGSWLYSDRNLTFSSVCIASYGLLLLWAQRQLLYKNLSTTVGAICSGMFLLSLVISIYTPGSAIVMVLQPFLAIALVMPSISSGALRWLSIVSWTIALIIIINEEIAKYGSIAGLFPNGIQMIGGVATTGAVFLFLLWQFSSHLKANLAHVQDANTALQNAHAQLAEKHQQLIQDIERRRQTEEALRRSEEHLQQIFDAAPIGMAMTSIEGRFIRVNQAICKMLGYSRDELIHTAIVDITHPEDRTLHLVLSQQLIDSTIHSYTLEKRYIDKHENVIDVLLQVVLLRNAEGNPLHYLSQMVDMTERKRNEEQRLKLERKLLETQKLESIGLLAGGIAHDFNNLLVGILGQSDLALLELPSDTLLHKRIAQIATAARRASELTQQMLAYAGKGRFVIEPIALNTMISETAQLLGASIKKNAQLSYELAPDLPLAEGDATQLRQVLMNLIVNASEALDAQGGDVTIRTQVRHIGAAELQQRYQAPDLAPAAYIVLEVSDTGCGMDAATLAKIFDPFFTTKFTGRGLGLAAVQGIVRSHGGALAVESAPGSGTTFYVLLPLAQIATSGAPPGKGPIELASVPLTPPPLKEADKRSQGRILVIDDEMDVRVIAEQMLQYMGFDVLTARSGNSGVNIFREHSDQIICVLLDLTMPHMPGEHVLHALRAIRADVPIVLMSGYSEQEVRERVDHDALAGFLQKPFTFSSLQSKLQQVIAAHNGRFSVQH